MGEFRCKRMRRSRYIERNIVFNIEGEERFGKFIESKVDLRVEEPLKTLGMSFYRNRIESQFEFGREDDEANERYRSVRIQIKDFCDTHLNSYWTWKDQRFGSSFDRNNVVYKLELFFEEEADLELFLKDCGTLIKLAN